MKLKIDSRFYMELLYLNDFNFYRNLKLYKHDYVFIYNDELIEITVDENNIFFNENLSRYFNPSLRNFALIINKEEMNPSYATEYFYYFSSDINKINFTDCIVQTPSDLTTLDEAHSCVSSDNIDSINRAKNVNKMNCPNIVSSWVSITMYLIIKNLTSF